MFAAKLTLFLLASLYLSSAVLIQSNQQDLYKAESSELTKTSPQDGLIPIIEPNSHQGKERRLAISNSMMNDPMMTMAMSPPSLKITVRVRILWFLIIEITIEFKAAMASGKGSKMS